MSTAPKYRACGNSGATLKAHGLLGQCLHCVRPRDWDHDLFEAAVANNGSRAENAHRNLLAYYRRVDQGEQALARFVAIPLTDACGWSAPGSWESPSRRARPRPRLPCAKNAMKMRCGTSRKPRRTLTGSGFTPALPISPKRNTPSLKTSAGPLWIRRTGEYADRASARRFASRHVS